MYLIDVIPTIKIPHTQPQILSYFFSAPLAAGTVIQIPLGKRKETGVVLDSHTLDEYKQEIKKADFELRHIAKVISAQPLLTSRQIELAVWLGQYYFASPGIFAKMMMPKKIPNPKSQIPNKFKIKKPQKLIVAPTISVTNKIAKEQPNSTVWHSELTKKQLNEAWWKIKNGEARMIVGTRSAVFLPFADLKEIVIEDETNPAHRSWDMWPHYQVYEVAKKLAEIFNAKLIFKNEVPSIESYFYERTGKFPKSDIRYPTSVIDLRAELKAGNFSIFSRELQKAISEALTQKKQIILFINRRGAANFVLCRDCGYTAKCPNCDLPLAYHLMNGKPIMFCHRCGRQEKPPSLCPQCQSWRVKTVGVGTQKVELETKKLFFQTKIARLDSDSAPSQKEQQKIIEAFAKKEIDILIATQIIFSWLDEIKPVPPATVALISADTLLHLPDFNSGERTFQTIMMLKNLISPRQNYSSNETLKFLPGKNFSAESKSSRTPPSFFIQTYNPESPIIKYAAQDDWQSFYQEEIAARQILKYPPFSQIVKLTFRHRDPQKAGQEAKILAAKLSLAVAPLSGAVKLKRIINSDQITDVKETKPRTESQSDSSAGVSDALPAFVPKEKGKYVWNIIIKFPIPSDKVESPRQSRDNIPPCGWSPAGRQYPLSSEFLRCRNSLLQYVPTNWEIDVDPVDLL